jgi:ubiquitin carboxyl-terminal hydrolase 14
VAKVYTQQLCLRFFNNARKKIINMAAIPVKVKHQGKVHEVELDPSSTGETFKYQLYSLTGVEPERQKILVKGGQLKDETELSTLKAKPGQTFMMMGTPASSEGAADVARPKEQIKFMEDMTEAEAARAEGAIPAGLQNLGNTCYLNSTLQTLKSVPELQEELSKYKTSRSGPSAQLFREYGLDGLGAASSADITASLRDLYKQMSETQEGFPPMAFLQTLRTVYPRFAEKSRTGHGYAQQDAEEVWTELLSDMRQKLKMQQGGESAGSEQARSDASFIDKYLSGNFETTLQCDEEAAREGGEEVERNQEVFLKLDCHIGKDTNHLRDGLLAGLEEKIEKRSAVLGRNAMYTKTSRVSRLPKYLTIHFIRFFWKRDANKKAKIMRKVTFPAELDAVEYCTETLRKKLIPVRDKVREIRKDEEDMARARKRQKIAHRQLEDQANDAENKADLEPLQKAKEKEKGKDKADDKEADTEMPDATYKTDAEYEAERESKVKAAKKDLFELIDQDLAKDTGSNRSGLYELRGVVTHQGASADSGHYTSYVKKTGAIDAKTGKRKDEDGKWWWFNDDKVSEVEASKIETLAGGGILYFFPG